MQEMALRARWNGRRMVCKHFHSIHFNRMHNFINVSRKLPANWMNGLVNIEFNEFSAIWSWNCPFNYNYMYFDTSINLFRTPYSLSVNWFFFYHFTWNGVRHKKYTSNIEHLTNEMLTWYICISMSEVKMLL